MVLETEKKKDIETFLNVSFLSYAFIPLLLRSDISVLVEYMHNCFSAFFFHFMLFITIPGFPHLKKT